MKKTLYLLFTLVFLNIYGCSDPCKNVTCFNNGTCNEGKCQCPDWIEGENCQIETRAKFYGTYIGTITVGGQTQNASAKLEEFVGDVNKIVLDENDYLSLTGSTTFDIPLQYLGSGNTVTISGSGSLNNNLLIYNALATQSGQTVVVNFTGTK